MITVIIILFLVGYAAIALEHPLGVNKAASALITAVLCWTVLFVGRAGEEASSAALSHHVGDISSILFFLLGAMTIVELIDSHNGFDIITNRITTVSKTRLLVIITVLSFFLSALLDNLTTAIVMTSLCSKILSDRDDRCWFAGMIIIAANAGGVWSPLGDVSTTMLWIGGQISALNIIKTLFLPSLAVCAVPLAILSFRFKDVTVKPVIPENCTAQEKKQGNIMLVAGITLLLFVPLFKTVTGLPPFMGMMLALGLMWVITTILHSEKPTELAQRYTVARALQKIDTPSILFFLGILLGVAALDNAGILTHLAGLLDRSLHDNYKIGIVLGLLSAVVDNVPLVAACQGMYDLTTYPMDHPFWEFLTLTTGTGGSAIIIGSAAGVAVMGIEQINFGWYLKKISWLALAGFAAGILVFMIQLGFALI